MKRSTDPSGRSEGRLPDRLAVGCAEARPPRSHPQITQGSYGTQFGGIIRGMQGNCQDCEELARLNPPPSVSYHMGKRPNTGEESFMNKEEAVKRTQEYIRGLMLGESSGHDWWHVYRVWQNTIYIGTQERADLFVAELTAVLADWLLRQTEALTKLPARNRRYGGPCWLLIQPERKDGYQGSQPVYFGTA
jgi:hypothetical protein